MVDRLGDLAHTRQRIERERAELYIEILHPSLDDSGSDEGPEFMHEWFTHVGAIRRAIDALRHKHAELAELHAGHRVTVNRAEMELVDAAVDRVMRQSNTLALEIKNSLSRLQEEYRRAIRERFHGRTEERIRTGQMQHLVQTFSKMVREYHDAQREAKLQRAVRIERQLKIVNPNATLEDFPDMVVSEAYRYHPRRALFIENSGATSSMTEIESGPPPQQQQQSEAEQLMKQTQDTSTQRLNAYENVRAELMARHEAIERIESSLAELRTIIDDLSTLEDGQNTPLDQIESYTSRDYQSPYWWVQEENWRMLRQNEAEAEERRRRRRKKRLICTLIVLVVLVVLVTVPTTVFLSKHKIAS